jgi:hypothetical protein
VTQSNSSPGVPRSLPTVVASSATPVLAGKTILSTETNVWPAVLIESGVVVAPFAYSTPIVLPNQVGFFPII